MEVFWLLVGAGGAWYVFSFRAIKAKMKRIAALEFVHFFSSLRAWDNDRDDLESQLQALHHFEVFNTRYSDFLADPTGRSLPAERAVLSRNFVDHMLAMGLIGANGRPNKYAASDAARVFWLSVESLSDLRRDVLASDPFMEHLESTPEATCTPKIGQEYKEPSYRDHERDRDQLIAAMRGK